MNNNSPILILGMHRSGTSMLSGILARLGVDLGGELIEADQHNPSGYWEHRNIILIHEEFLAGRHSSWHDVRLRTNAWFQKGAGLDHCKSQLTAELLKDFSDSELWGLKDPRICRLLPMWFQILDELGCKPRFIIAYRNPMEVVASLERRGHGFSAYKSLLLWLRHVLEAEYWTRQHPRVFVSYASVLENWADVVERIAATLKIEWPDMHNARPGVEQFVQREMRHHKSSDGLLRMERPLAEWGKAAFDALGVAQTEPGKSVELFERIRMAMSRYDRFANVIENDRRAHLPEPTRKPVPKAKARPT